MVLDDISRGSNAVVVAGPSADTDVLGHCDLNVVDVIAVPDWLEHLVGKAKRQNVLNRLFAKVMIDAKNRILWENSFHNLVELSSGLKI